ncbi:MAG TPA: hypothetical protein PK177_09270 [Burkholderiaceae bacterium]|nr:hypothetical protein [Burkholderiaceae bacterium]
MTITFLPLAATHDTATGAHRRRTQSLGSAITLTGVRRFAAGTHPRRLHTAGLPGGANGSTGAHRRRMHSLGTATGSSFDVEHAVATGTHRRTLHSLGTAVAGALDIDPEIPAIGTHGRVHASGGEAYAATFVEGEHRRTARAFGYAVGITGATYDASGTHRRAVSSTGWDHGDAATGNGLLVAMPMHVSGFAGQWFYSARDRISSSQTVSSLPIHVLRGALAAVEFRSGAIEALLQITDAVALDARAGVVLFETITDLVLLAPTAQYDYRAIARAVDRLLADGAARGYVEAISVVLDAMVLRSLASGFDFEQVSDSVVLSKTVADAYTALGQVIDRLLMQPEATGAQRLTAIVRDTVAFDGELGSAAEFAEAIRDAVGLSMHLTVDSGDYVAWVLNTEGKGVSTYTNYPFNSFMELGGKWYGVASGGLYMLEGADDDGTPIPARIRLGLHDMNTRKLKRLPEAYIGYKSDGNLILRVITADDHTGEKVAAEYLMRPRAAPNIRESRFEPGRGIKAVDWDFEIENINGADFDLAEVEFHPLIMDRRTRG